MHALVAGELWTTDAVLAREPVGAVRSSETFPMPMRGLLRVAGSLIIAAGASGACKSEGAGPRERPTALAFLTQPALTEVDSAIAPPVRVAIHDQAGVLDTTAAPAVTIALEANPDSGTLSGTMTVNAVAGIATFHDLRIDRPANGYTLVARGSNLLLSTSNPFRVKRTFTALSSSGEYSCAVSQGGKTYCWGNNVGGQPGDSTGIQRVRPVLVRRVRLTTVDAGTENTCGISTDSIAYCWGANANGELGDGTGQQWFAPVTVAGGYRFLQVSVGGTHTCAVAVGGDAYCWGSNYNGRLGDSGVTHSLSPRLVSGGLKFSQISAGTYHSCGVTPGHRAYCWGSNAYGGLGNGTTDSSFVPIPVDSTLAFRQITAAEEFTCGVTTANVAYCWGWNGNGTIGDSTIGSNSRPVPTLIAGGLSVNSISVGTAHACVVTTGQAAYCWGAGNDGRLGDGTGQQRLIPTPVTGGLSFSQVSAGWAHTCGLTPDGDVYCWGLNGSGQLGDNTTSSQPLPTPTQP